MRLKEFRIKNFRGYKDEVTVTFDGLTILVGRNDIGKSTILEAMDIFFNEKNAINQIDNGDINKNAMNDGDMETVFTAVFDELPPKIILDETVETTLQNEMLLDGNNSLSIVKKYQSAGKPKVYIKANHPSNEECNNLLILKIADLKKKAVGLDCIDRTKKLY